jgi:hypothetical protein
VPTLTLSQNPCMICHNGEPSRGLPRFVPAHKHAIFDFPKRDEINVFLEENDGDELDLLDRRTTPSWHAIRTLANREREIAHLLRQRRMSYFLPMVKVRAKAS